MMEGGREGREGFLIDDLSNSCIFIHSSHSENCPAGDVWSSIKVHCHCDVDLTN